MGEVTECSVIPAKAGIHRVEQNRFDSASDEAGVYRIMATDVFITGSASIRRRPRAVWHRHGAQVALLRCPIPRDDPVTIPELVGGFKAIDSEPHGLEHASWVRHVAGQGSRLSRLCNLVEVASI